MKKNPKILTLGVLALAVITAGFFIMPKNAKATSYTWDGEGSTNDWSECANWTSNTCPTSSDSVTFDGTSSKDATIDGSFQGTIISFTIASGYSGTITQARTLTINGPFSQATGTFTGATQSIDINDGAGGSGTWALSGGTFTSTSGTMTINNNFTVTNSPSFNANGGTITFDGTLVNSTLSCGSITFSTVGMNKNSGAVTVGSNCSLPLGNSPTTGQGGNNIVNNGTITVGTGIWTNNGSYTGNTGSTVTTSGSEIKFLGDGSANFTLSGGTFATGITTLTVQGSLTLTSGTFPSGLTTLTLSGNLTNTGSLLPNGVTMTLAGNQASSLTCGTVTWTLVIISKNAGNVTVGSDCIIPLGNSASLNVASGLINNGTINAGTGTLSIRGPYTQNNGSVLTMIGTTLVMTDFGNLTLNGGTFPQGLTTLTIEGNLDNNGNLLPNGVLFTVNGNQVSSLICGTEVWATPVAISKSLTGVVTVGADCTLPLGTNPTSSSPAGIVNNGTINVTGTWTLNGSYTSNTGAVLTISGNTFLVLATGAGGGDLILTGGSFPQNITTMEVDEFLSNTGNLLPDGIDLSIGANVNATMNCGDAIFASTTINKTLGYPTTYTADCHVSGNFTRTNGAVSNTTLTLVTNDSTSNGNNLTNHSTTTTTGQIASGVALTPNQYLDKSSFSLGAASVTMSAWVYSTNFAQDGMIIEKDPVNADWELFVNSSGGSGVYLRGASTTSVIASLPSNSQWHYIVGTITGTTGTIYIDGVQAATGAVTAIANSTNSLNIGRYNSGYYFTGKIDEARVSNIARPADWVKAEYLSSAQTYNSYGSEESSVVLSGWSNRRQITFDNSASSTNLTDFPVLVALTSSNIDYSKVQDAGQDIRFTDSDGTTLLSYEIEKWDETGTSYVWVKVPQIDLGSTTDNIYVYYNNTSATDGQAATSVWNSNYKAVYHLGTTSPVTVFIGGNLSMSSTSDFGGSNLNIELNGTGTQTISQNASFTFSSPLRINKTAGVAQLSTNLTTTTATCTVIQGTYYLNTHNFTCGGTFTVQSSGTLKLQGTETSTAPTLDSGSTVLYIGDGDSLADTLSVAVASTYSNLIINSTDGTTDTFTLGNSPTVNGTLTITAGAFNQGTTRNLTAGAISVASGTTYTNTGTGDITLAGTVTNSGRMTLRSNGTCGGSNDIVIASSSGGVQRSWNGTGRYYMSDLNVSDMGGTGQVYVGSGTSVSGNDTNWHFANCQTFTQSAYRWYENADSVQPGTALDSENTTANLSGSSMNVRLRMGVTTNNIHDYSGDRAYKLQYSTNTSSGIWSDVAPAWWNLSWLNRKKFAIDNSSSNSNLTNFPVLITLTTSTFDYSKTKAGGADIRFVDADGLTSLNYEIEKWDSSGTSNIWVSVPQIDAASTQDFITMYYNNTAATDAQAATSVWDSSYVGVYHLPNGSSLTANDSTSTPANGTLTNTPTAATGQIDGAASFASASTQYINLGTASKLNSTATTISAWVKATSFPGAYNTIVSKVQGDASRYLQLLVKSNGKLTADVFAGSSLIYDGTGAFTLSTGTWYYITYSYDSVNGIIGYVNGVVDGTVAANGAIQSNAGSTLIGHDSNTAGRDWNGAIDEVRISNIARSIDWIKAEYKTENGTFGNFGPQETLNVFTLNNYWRFENNPTPTTGATVSSTLLTGSNVAGNYEEDIPTPTNATEILPTDQVEFDWALVPTSRAYLGTTYYFRMVQSDGTPLDTYTVYGQLLYGNLSARGGAATGGSSGAGTPGSGGGQTGGNGGTGGSSGGGTPQGGGGSNGGGATP